MNRVVILILGFMFSGCSSQNSVYIKVLSAKDFKNEMAQIKNVQLIDVRTQTEYNRGHIEGAVLVDYFSKNFKDNLQFLNKNEPVFIYCRSGNRSKKASRVLEKLGFTKIYDLKGGFNSWK